MRTMASQITRLTIAYSTVYSGALKLRDIGLCVGNSPVAGEFPAQKASNAENVSIWWRHHNVHLTRPLNKLSSEKERKPTICVLLSFTSALWVSNYRHLDCLLSCCFRLTTRKIAWSSYIFIYICGCPFFERHKKGSVMRKVFPCDDVISHRYMGPLLLTWFNFNPSMDK